MGLKSDFQKVKTEQNRAFVPEDSQSVERQDVLRTTSRKNLCSRTQQEQDSVKTRIRQYEKARHIEDTFFYFNPSEK